MTKKTFSFIEVFVGYFIALAVFFGWEYYTDQKREAERAEEVIARDLVSPREDAEVVLEMLIERECSQVVQLEAWKHFERAYELSSSAQELLQNGEFEDFYIRAEEAKNEYRRVGSSYEAQQCLWEGDQNTPSPEQLLFVRRWNEAPVLVAAGDGGRQVGFFDLRRLA